LQLLVLVGKFSSFIDEFFCSSSFKKFFLATYIACLSYPPRRQLSHHIAMVIAKKMMSMELNLF